VPVLPDIDLPETDGSPVAPSGLPSDEEYVYLPPAHSTLRRVVYSLGAIAAVVVVLLALGGWWVLNQVNPSGGPGDPVTLIVPTGSSTAQIGTLLQDKGVVSNSAVFQYYVKFRGAGPFKAGEYDGLYENDSMDNVVTRLKKGPLAPRTRQLAIPEGLTVAEVKAKILEVFPEMNATELDTAMATVRSKYQPADSTNLEGLLFPATYEVLESDAVDEQKLVQQMVTKFDQVGDSIGLDQAQAKVGLSPYQAVIAASLIEREAKVAGDRPKISRVIANRLAVGQRLEIDASLEYALGVKGKALNASQLKTDSPFNLRKVAGLPPTPIASPGQASLEAALNPEAGPWLYYVLANKDGSHYFTADYNDFLRAKKVAQQQGLLGG